MWYYMFIKYIMPYAIRKVRSKSCYRVYNTKNRRVTAKCTTLHHAKKQIRLLNAIHYNPKFRSTMKRRRP